MRYRATEVPFIEGGHRCWLHMDGYTIGQIDLPLEDAQRITDLLNQADGITERSHTLREQLDDAQAEIVRLRGVLNDVLCQLCSTDHSVEDIDRVIRIVSTALRKGKKNDR